MAENNPYTKASGTYSSATKAAAEDGRALESVVLMKSASKLELLAKRIELGEKVKLEEIEDTLKINRNIWEIFLDNMEDPSNAMPKEIKNNVASLAMFVFKHTNQVLADTRPQQFKILIDINRNIATGLSKKPPATKEAEGAKKEPQQAPQEASKGINTDI